MQSSNILITFQLDELWLGMPIENVIRITRAVEITPQSEKPSYILGLINVAGEAVPVFDMRKMLALTSQVVRAKDYLILARAGQRQFGLVVSRIEGTLAYAPNDIIELNDAAVGTKVKMIQRQDRLIVVHDFQDIVDRFDQEAPAHAPRAVANVW